MELPTEQGDGTMTAQSIVNTRVETVRMILTILGLGCGGSGALAVERALVRTPGVIHAYANPATEMAYVEFDPSQCDVETLVRAVRRAGFRVSDPHQH
jgi:copper chaperone CopZ